MNILIRVLEVFTCGTPVCLTGYLKENETNSDIVPVHDVKSTVSKVGEVMNSPEASITKIIEARKVLPQFVWANLTEKMLMYFSKDNQKKKSQ